MIVDNTKNILKKYNKYAKKILGQNFLIKKDVLEDIVTISNLQKSDNVIEIGPGLGTLTEFLCINSGQVLSYEIDSDMIEILKDTLKEYENVKIVHQDILKVDINEDIKKYFDEKKVKVVANIPYYITTPIINKFLECDNIELMLFMMQKEVAKRMCARVGSKDYAALSVIMQYKCDVEIKLDVNRNFFSPAPNVDSVLLLVKPKKNDYGLKNEAKFLKFIQHIFEQRRKTIVNNINKTYLVEKEQIEKKLESLGISKRARAEQLDIFQIVALYKMFFEI